MQRQMNIPLTHKFLFQKHLNLSDIYQRVKVFSNRKTCQFKQYEEYVEKYKCRLTQSLAFGRKTLICLSNSYVPNKLLNVLLIVKRPEDKNIIEHPQYLPRLMFLHLCILKFKGSTQQVFKVVNLPKLLNEIVILHLKVDEYEKYSSLHLNS